LRDELKKGCSRQPFSIFGQAQFLMDLYWTCVFSAQILQIVDLFGCGGWV